MSSKPIDAREAQRLERVEKLLSGERRLTTAARMFDEQAYREATVKAAGRTGPSGGEKAIRFLTAWSRSFPFYRL